jgi:hypothetical protein
MVQELQIGGTGACLKAFFEVSYISTVAQPESV